MSRRLSIPLLAAALAMTVPALIDVGARAVQSPADPASLIKDLRWRNIGNANLIGRISAVDALDSD